MIDQRLHARVMPLCYSRAAVLAKHEAIAGVGLGFVVGILVGMSASAVVSSVISALAAALAAFFGLSATADEKGSARLWRIAAFGFACPLAVILGVTIRTHNWLSPPIGTQLADWTRAGYTPEQARSLVLMKNMGLVPQGTQVAAPVATALNSILFSSGGQEDSVLAECTNLSASRFPNVDARLEAMRRAGNGWKQVADAVASIDAAQREPVIDAAHRLACR